MGFHERTRHPPRGTFFDWQMARIRHDRQKRAQTGAVSHRAVLAHENGAHAGRGVVDVLSEGVFMSKPRRPSADLIKRAASG